ncbi:PIR protein [Plasmodium ovale]|uniref:PIR Superfamily Protein n=2 Tax=Plasmodium ovale TaxID=36330 RepID=A0A1A8X9I0_PLAOA|nr:PIR Superfamily Protein [Plasmodium ovale curtisi]SBT83241.1 PIR protein [Plasmodium ovale]
MAECDNVLDKLDAPIKYSWYDISSNIIRSGHCNDDEHDALLNDVHFKNFCYKFATNFTYLIIRWNGNQGYDKESCDYLNYWAYHKLINNFVVKDDDISQSDFMKTLRNLWAAFNVGDDKCRLKEYKMSVSDFKNVKDLHDYSVNYDSLKKNILPNSISCKTNYCSYIKHMMEVYEKVSAEISECKHQEVCTTFKAIEESKRPETLFKEFGCSSDNVDNSLMEQMQSSDTGIEDTLTFHESYTSRNSPTDTALKAIFSTFAISLISSFLAYRYTPFGNWFRSRILRKNGFGNILHHKETEELLDNNSEIEDTIFEKDLNLKFQPVTNS